MSMSPENYRGLEARCKELCFNCDNIMDTFENDTTGKVELEAKDAYDALIEMETELNLAIKNAKTASISAKYEKCLCEIRYFKRPIYLIAHVI